jgi:hypothetical protein
VHPCNEIGSSRQMIVDINCLIVSPREIAMVKLECANLWKLMKESIALW